MVGNKVCRVATYVTKFLQDTFRVFVVFDMKNEQCVWKMTRRQTDEFCKFIFCSWKTPDVWCVVSYYYQNGDMDDFRTRIDLISMLRFTSQGRERWGLKFPCPNFVPCPLTQHLCWKKWGTNQTQFILVCLPLKAGKTWMPKNGRNQDVVNATTTSQITCELV